MKTILLLLSTTSLFAQSKFSVGPTYWFNYGLYAFQLRSTYDGSIRDYAGYSTASSIGLIAHYYFNQRWSLSLGALYTQSVSHVKVLGTGRDYTRLPIQKEFQFPVLVNYRLSSRRLAPYVSAGAFFAKERLLNDDALRSIRTYALLGIGEEYKFNAKFSWRLQPTASYLLAKPDNPLPLQFTSYHLYWIGLQTQLLLHF